MSLTCTTCGAAAMAVKPGTAAKMCAGITYERGVPDEAWCWAHLLARFGARQPDLFSEKTK